MCQLLGVFYLRLTETMKKKSLYKLKKELSGRKSPAQILKDLGITKEEVQKAATELHFKSVGATPLARRLLANARMY